MLLSFNRRSDRAVGLSSFEVLVVLSGAAPACQAANSVPGLWPPVNNGPQAGRQSLQHVGKEPLPQQGRVGSLDGGLPTSTEKHRSKATSREDTLLGPAHKVQSQSSIGCTGLNQALLARS